MIEVTVTMKATFIGGDEALQFMRSQYDYAKTVAHTIDLTFREVQSEEEELVESYRFGKLIQKYLNDYRKAGGRERN